MNSSRCQCEQILASARDLGACAAAFVELGEVDELNQQLYNQFIAEERHGGMDYLAKYDDVRRDPRLLLDGAKSMLCLAFAYHEPGMPSSSLFADYAIVNDYHKVLRKLLKPLAAMMEELVPGSATRICIDTAPLREKYWAARAGLGFIGLNNLLIIPNIGSKLFLAEILWTANTEPNSTPKLNFHDCESCQRCVRACPGHALDGRGGMDCRKCLSYLTIENRNADCQPFRIPGSRVYGCDICQNVCPHNHSTQAAVIKEFSPDQRILGLTPEAILAMTDGEFAEIFAHSAVKRLGLNYLKRNVAFLERND